MWNVNIIYSCYTRNEQIQFAFILRISCTHICIGMHTVVFPLHIAKFYVIGLQNGQMKWHCVYDCHYKSLDSGLFRLYYLIFSIL